MRQGVAQLWSKLAVSTRWLALLLLLQGCEERFSAAEPESEQVGSSCTSGSFQCAGNVLQTCNASGTGWDNQSICASEALCDAAQRTCVPPACDTGARRCQDAEAQLCNPARNGWTTLQTCTSASRCNGETGSCTDDPCSPGALQCNGAVLQACSADRSAWNVVSTCGSPALCNKDAGLCNPSVCEAGEFHCNGAELQTCNATLDGWTTLQICDSVVLCDQTQGTCGKSACSTPGIFRCTRAGGLERCSDDLTGWLPLLSCPSAAQCDAVRGICSDTPCTPGARQCNGETLEACNADRTGWEEVMRCATDGLCQQTLSGTSSTCALPACDAGQTQCDQAQPQICNAARTGYKPNGPACASVELCNAASGTCANPVCDPNQARCTGAQPEICNPGRTGYAPNGAPCASVALCNDATGTCGNQACVAGQLRCDPLNPTHLQRCKDDLTDWEAEPCDVCETAALCNASLGAGTCGATSCREPVCTAGQPHCGGSGTDTGKVLEVCNAGRTGYDPCQTCVTPELCDASRSKTPFSCTATACTAPSCNPSDLWCGGSGNVALYQCPPSRINTQATLLDTCVTNGLCEAAHQKGATKCDAPSCALSDRWCGGNGNLSLYQCPASRINTQATVLDTCKSNALCEASRQAGKSTCQAPACSSGQTKCGGSGSTLQMCKSDLTGYADCDTCSSAALCADSLGASSCSSSACHACIAGESRCNDDGDYETCKPDGSGVTVTDCDDYGCDEESGGCIAP